MLQRLTNPEIWPGRLMTIFAALVLLSMPVDYKGGAELSHAHGLFQFWIPGGHVDLDWQDHHHDPSPEDQQGAQLSHVIDIPSGQQIDPSPDRPTLSEIGNPSEKASGIAVSLLLVVVALFTTRGSLLWIYVQNPRGLLPSPEAPPPRTLGHTNAK